MSRHSQVLVSLFICFLFLASYFTPGSSSQSTLRSLSLNGTNQFVTAPSSTSLNITGAITVEGWIKLNSVGVYQAIVSREAFQQVGSGGENDLDAGQHLSFLYSQSPCAGDKYL